MASSIGTNASTPTSSAPAPPGYQTSKRTPTDSSYYDFNGTPWDKDVPNTQTWMYARDARAQQATVPAGRGRKYPSPFGNHTDNLPLSTPPSKVRPGRPPEWLHHPLIPGQTQAWKPGSGTTQGGVRSFYTDGNPTVFDVGYHDPKKPPQGQQKHSLFLLAKYHPRVTPPLPTSSGP